MKAFCKVVMRFPIWLPVGRSLLIEYTRNFETRISFFSSRKTEYRLKMNGEVVHDEANNEFFISLGKEKAILRYQLLGKEILDIYHTEVPESERGKGLAGHLVKAGLSYVVEKNLKVLPTCSYVDYYINKNKPQDIMQRVIYDTE